MGKQGPLVGLCETPAVHSCTAADLIFIWHQVAHSYPRARFQIPCGLGSRGTCWLPLDYHKFTSFLTQTSKALVASSSCFLNSITKRDVCEGHTNGFCLYLNRWDKMQHHLQGSISKILTYFLKKKKTTCRGGKLCVCEFYHTNGFTWHLFGLHLNCKFCTVFFQPGCRRDFIFQSGACLDCSFTPSFIALLPAQSSSYSNTHSVTQCFLLEKKTAPGAYCLWDLGQDA